MSRTELKMTHHYKKQTFSSSNKKRQSSGTNTKITWTLELPGKDMKAATVKMTQ